MPERAVAKFIRTLSLSLAALVGSILLASPAHAQPVKCNNGQFCPQGMVCVEGGMCAIESGKCAAGFRPIKKLGCLRYDEVACGDYRCSPGNKCGPNGTCIGPNRNNLESYEKRCESGRICNKNQACAEGSSNKTGPDEDCVNVVGAMVGTTN